jgi:hypothetical protein
MNLARGQYPWQDQPLCCTTGIIVGKNIADEEVKEVYAVQNKSIAS